MISVTDLKEIFYQAMLDMFGAIDNGVQAYSELAFQLENMQREERDDILNDIFYLYFGKSITELTEEFSEAGEGVKFNPQSVVITKGKGFQGNVLETVEQLTLREMQKILKDKNITTSSIGTGSSGAKADNILTIGFQLTDKQVDLLTGKSLLSSSVREQNIQRMQQFHKSLQDSKQSGYIVEISDKNYNLTSARFASEKGFTAQHNVKLINLKQTLKNIKFQQGKVEDIIFILANSGTNLINEKETSEATHYLATLIGYFLFDDIDIKNFIPTQPSAIHLLNLDGVYIPLSVFLEAACEAFATSVEQAEKFTYVTFHETKEGKNYNTDNILTENDWIRFREERMNNSSVNFHFFGDFVNFISQKL